MSVPAFSDRFYSILTAGHHFAPWHGGMQQVR